MRCVLKPAVYSVHDEYRLSGNYLPPHFSAAQCPHSQGQPHLPTSLVRLDSTVHLSFREPKSSHHEPSSLRQCQPWKRSWSNPTPQPRRTRFRDAIGGLSRCCAVGPVGGLGVEGDVDVTVLGFRSWHCLRTTLRNSSLWLGWVGPDCLFPSLSLSLPLLLQLLLLLLLNVRHRKRHMTAFIFRLLVHNWYHLAS